MIDGEVVQNTTELIGADVTTKTPCTISSPATGRNHGTGVASILVSSNYGVAPDASLIAYRAAFGADGDTTGPDCRDDNGNSKSEYPWLLNWAMNDGAQVINLSASSSLQSDELKWAIARSISQGVIITAAAGNEATDWLCPSGLELSVSVRSVLMATVRTIRRGGRGYRRLQLAVRLSSAIFQLIS